MGNISSQVNNDLKRLYSMNKFEMEALRKELNQERQQSQDTSQEKQRLYYIIQTQQKLRGKIPQNKYNQVSEFLDNIQNDIKAHENQVPKWTPESKPTLHHPSDFRQERFQPQYSDRVIPQMNPQRDYYEKYSERQHMREPIKQANQNQTQDRRQQFHKSNESNIDPYELYGFDKNQKIDIKTLKDKYKTYAMQTHPDRNNGNMRNFQIITKAYKKLLEIYKTQQDDKQYTELKNNSLSYLEEQSKTNKRNTKFDNNNFDVNKFNSIFSENKIESVSEQGYNDWINTNKFDSDSIVKRSNINTGNFNKYFDSDVKCTKELTKYTDPIALEINNFNSHKLGEEKVDNYSGKTEHISFSDYKEAHTTSRLVDPNTKYKSYRNIGELENSRSNIADFTPEEIQRYELQKLREEEREEKRLQNLQTFDERHFKNYDKVHNIMLNM